jgi:hypothetical protein
VKNVTCAGTETDVRTTGRRADMHCGRSAVLSQTLNKCVYLFKITCKWEIYTSKTRSLLKAKGKQEINEEVLARRGNMIMIE